MAKRKAKKEHFQLALLEPDRFASQKAVRAFLRSDECFHLFEACRDPLWGDGAYAGVTPKLRKAAGEMAWYLLDDLRTLAEAAASDREVELEPATLPINSADSIAEGLEALMLHQAIVSTGQIIMPAQRSVAPIFRVIRDYRRRHAGPEAAPAAGFAA